MASIMDDDKEMLPKGSTMLYEALTMECGIQGIVNVAEKILNNPVLVADTSFRVIAHAEKPDMNDGLWMEIIEQGFYPARYVYSIARDKWQYRQVMDNSSALILDEKGLPNRYMSKIVKVNNTPVGFVSCIEYEQPFSELDMKLFHVLCRVVGAELRGNQLINHEYVRSYEYFIAEMITGSLNTVYLNERIRQVGFKSKKNMFILVAEFVDNENREHQMKFFCRSFEQSIPDSYCVSYYNSLVLFISRDSQEILTETFVEKVESLLKDSNMIGGLSHRFRDIVDLRLAYLQACQAILMGRKLEVCNRIYDYSQMSVYHMLDIVGDRERLRQFCNQKLLDIAEYDSNYDTKYAGTAYTYLRSGKNPAMTARTLDIHRNTVDYRIKKIEELFNVDFNKQEVVFSFDLSFHILEYLGEMKLLL